LAWIRALKRHVQYIENEKLRLSTTPPEELPDEQVRRGGLSEAQRLAQYFDDDTWTADAPAEDPAEPVEFGMSRRSLQLLEEDLQYVQSRKKQYAKGGEIWDLHNTFDFDGDLDRDQRLNTRRQQQLMKQQQHLGSSSSSSSSSSSALAAAGPPPPPMALSPSTSSASSSSPAQRPPMGRGFGGTGTGAGSRNSVTFADVASSSSVETSAEAVVHPLTLDIE
jgi:hypothetical protein